MEGREKEEGVIWEVKRWGTVIYNDKHGVELMGNLNVIVEAVMRRLIRLRENKEDDAYMTDTGSSQKS